MSINIDNSVYSNASASQSSSSQGSNGEEQTREDQLRVLQERAFASQLALLQAFGATPNTLNQFREMNDSERQSVLRQHSENHQARIAEPRNDSPPFSSRTNNNEREFLERQGVLVIGDPFDNASPSHNNSGRSPAAGG